MRLGQYSLGICAALTVTFSTHADIIWFNDADAWNTAVRPSSAVDFSGFDNGTVITDHYAAEGVFFMNFVFVQHSGFWSDGAGLFGNDGIKFTFETPQHAVAVDFLGSVAFALYLEGVLVGTTPSFGNVNLFPIFLGIHSEHEFDEVHLFKPWPPYDNNIISIDTLYWGSVPTPGALPLLVLAFLTSRRRRRSG